MLPFTAMDVSRRDFVRFSASATGGATRAMALEVLTEWRLATASPAFKAWLDRGAPSEDRQTA